MYPEFIAIYVMLAIVIILLAVILVIGLKLLINSNKGGGAPQSNANPYGQQYQQPYQQGYQAQGGNVVFCRHCATQFDAAQGFCPRCGTPR